MEDNIQILYETMAASDYILVGAGAGLSAAAGISFADEKAFARDYPVLWQKGIHSDYQTFSYRDWPPEQQWAYWARHIQAVRFDTPPLPLYAELLALLEGFDYHIITSNVDRQFYRSGFPMERVHEAQGTYDQLICSALCTEEEWPIGPVTVSYTHLDVYKRQVYTIRADQFICVIASLGQHDGAHDRSGAVVRQIDQLCGHRTGCNAAAGQAGARSSAQ